VGISRLLKRIVKCVWMMLGLGYRNHRTVLCRKSFKFAVYIQMGNGSKLIREISKYFLAAISTKCWSFHVISMNSSPKNALYLRKHNPFTTATWLYTLTNLCQVGEVIINLMRCVKGPINVFDFGRQSKEE
jgi:hypothetical protein